MQHKILRKFLPKPNLMPGLFALIYAKGSGHMLHEKILKIWCVLEYILIRLYSEKF